MTALQKVIKYLAIAFAVFLVVSIVSGILSAVRLLGGFAPGDAVADEVKTYSVTNQIHDLNIRINAADLCIKEGETFLVESNLKHLKVQDKDGVLNVEETTKFSRTYNGAVLTVYVPAETIFDRAVLVTGAGRLTVDRLSANVLELELGAGEVSVGYLSAQKYANIEGGAGRVTVSDGALRELDLEMGVGQLNLTAALTGECELDLGVGESNITLIGEQDDYRLDLEKGLGTITVDGKQVSDPGSSGNGPNSVEINGGVGAVRVTFTHKTEDTDA